MDGYPKGEASVDGGQASIESEEFIALDNPKAATQLNIKRLKLIDEVSRLILELKEKFPELARNLSKARDNFSANQENIPTKNLMNLLTQIQQNLNKPSIAETIKNLVGEVVKILQPSTEAPPEYKLVLALSKNDFASASIAAKNIVQTLASQIPQQVQVPQTVATTQNFQTILNALQELKELGIPKELKSAPLKELETVILQKTGIEIDRNFQNLRNLQNFFYEKPTYATVSLLPQTTRLENAANIIEIPLPKDFPVQKIFSNILQNIPQNLLQNLPQNLSPNLPQDTLANAQPNTPQSAPPNTQPNIPPDTSQSTPQNIPQNTQPNIPQSAQPSMPQSTPPNTQPNIQPNVPPNTPQDVSQNTQPNIPQSTPPNVPPNLPQSASLNTPLNIPQNVQPNTPQNMPQEAQPNILPNAPQNMPQSTQPSVPPNLPQDIPKETQPNIPPNTPQNFSQNMQHSTQPDTRQNIPLNMPQKIEMAFSLHQVIASENTPLPSPKFILQPWPASTLIPKEERDFWLKTDLPLTPQILNIRDTILSLGKLPENPAVVKLFASNLHEMSLQTEHGTNISKEQASLLWRVVTVANTELPSVEQRAVTSSMLKYQPTGNYEGELFKNLPQTVKKELQNELPVGKTWQPETLQKAVEKILEKYVEPQLNKASQNEHASKPNEEIRQVLQNLKEQIQWTRIDQDTRHDRENTFYFMHEGDLQKGRLKIKDERKGNSKKQQGSSISFSIETKTKNLGDVHADLTLSKNILNIRLQDSVGTASEAVQTERETLAKELADIGIVLGELLYGKTPKVKNLPINKTEEKKNSGFDVRA
jgi:hypothetical protein